MTTTTRPTIGVLLEQTLGHVSHGQNLRRSLSDTSEATLLWEELGFQPTQRRHRVPPFTNWSVRSSLSARDAVRAMERKTLVSGLFVHTHVPATLLGPTMSRIPTVVSVDATPKQIDSLGGSYRHDVQRDWIENAKWRFHARAFQQAAGFISWSRWGAHSLVDDYGVDADRVDVIPPGVISSQWRRAEPRTRTDGPIRILFVGGDFERKGGDLLLEAFERLRHDHEVIDQGLELELHLVTSADIEPTPGIHVHRGLTPNSPELIALFHSSDIFTLPTRGDCTPLVLAEAATAGLPAVATDVGAISELVIDGVTGEVVEPTAESLTAGLRRVVLNADYRLQLGTKAAEHAAFTMDATKNARRLLSTVIERTSRPKQGRVVLTVSGVVPKDLKSKVAIGERPLADYQAIADASGASLLDWVDVANSGSRVTEMIRRTGGHSLAIAHHVFRNRRNIDVVITDGEQIGLPLAAMLRFGGRKSLRHVMIGHRLSPAKKTLPARMLNLADGIDDILVYSSSQRQTARRVFPLPDHRIRLIDFMVDTEFFRPMSDLRDRGSRTRPLICTAGREFRDYPTFIEAVRGLDVDVVIASASPWSKRSDNAQSVDLPDNVTVTSLTQRELRDLLDRSDLLVMPLLQTDFQAGITTILEAMAMERPVICTGTVGQTDVVVEGINGRYVPPGDPLAMRRAILDVLSNPVAAAAMGRQGRNLVIERADVRFYADLFARITSVHLHGADHGSESDAFPLSSPIQLVESSTYGR